MSEQVNPAGQLRPLKARKPGEYRDVPLPEFVSEAIDAHLAVHGCTSDGYHFQGRKTKLVIRDTYHRLFRPAAKAAGLPVEFVPHWLRHLYASITLGNGVPITDLSPWLGHRKIETTYQIYRQLIPGAGDRARNILDDAFAPPGRGKRGGGRAASPTAGSRRGGRGRAQATARPRPQAA